MHGSFYSPIASSRCKGISLAVSDGLSMMFLNSVQGIIVHDSDGRISEVNTTAQEMLGCAPCDLVGHQSADVLVEYVDHRGRILARENQPAMITLRLRHPFRSFVIGMRRPGEETTWFSVSTEIVHVEDGTIRIVEGLSDITSERKIEKDRHQQIVRARATDNILAAVAQGVVVTDAGHNITYVNPAFEKITGYAASDVVGKNCGILQGTQPDADVTRAIANSIEQGQVFSGTVLNYRKDGAAFWNELAISPVYDEEGEVGSYIGIINDVTVKVNRDEELQNALVRAEKSEARLTAILETAPVGIVSVDHSGRVLAFNKEAEAIFGYRAAEIAGSTIDPLIPVSAREQHRQHVAEFDVATATRRPMSNWRTVSGRRKNGEVFPLFAMISKTTVGSDRTMTVVFKDMTEIKNRERELERLAAEKQLELNKAENAMEARSNFLATMSHELRTPLNAIIGFSELICAESFGVIGNARYAEYVRDINKSGRHLLSIINDILDLSRIQSSQYELKLSEVDLFEVVSTAIKLFSPDEKAHNQMLIRCDGASNLRPAGDQRAVLRVLMNLLSNAAKFSPSGSTIKVSTEKLPDRRIAVTIEDSGRGIAADKIYMLGEPFVQLSNPYLRDAGGTGLGLAICKALVTAMHGEMKIESQVGVGTKVSVILNPWDRSALS